MPAVTPPPASVRVSGAGSVADSVDAAPVVSVSLTLPAVVSVAEAEVSGLSPPGVQADSPPHSTSPDSNAATARLKSVLFFMVISFLSGVVIGAFAYRPYS